MRKDVNFKLVKYKMKLSSWGRVTSWEVKENLEVRTKNFNANWKRDESNTKTWC